MDSPKTQQNKQALYDAWWNSEIDKGLADVVAGRVTSDGDTKVEMALFIAELQQELKLKNQSC